MDWIHLVIFFGAVCGGYLLRHGLGPFFARVPLPAATVESDGVGRLHPLVDALAGVARNPQAAGLLAFVESSGVGWTEIAAVLIAHRPHIVLGSWPPVIAALVALVPPVRQLPDPRPNPQV